ncbi:MAG: outer membrane beta-barrel family protein, partial [Muribaculaceae bacterium]|nr:outer membrane beta-barrel family protein [Muribaculaceae bacterium]
ARQSDYFNYSLGGNISHTTRKIELSGDISRNDSKGKNDTYKEYIFQDYSRISDRRNEFTWQTLGINGLFKYKFNNRWSAGVIVNYSNNRTKNNIIDKTIDRGESLLSQTIVPFYPENAVTLTGFADWAIDDKGKMLSLTYNRFDKRLSSFSDISTQWEDSKITRITKDDSNRYGIHSVKLDATLPFHSFKIETGGAYTAIRNKTGLTISNDIAGSLVVDPAQSNHFRYDEKTAALYISAEKNITNSLFGKIGLRYEHTDVAVLQEADNSRNRNGHDYLFPTVLLSWSIPDGGRLAADYSMGISRPSFGDLNPFRYYTTVNDYFTGNPKLKSMIVHNVGINYSYKGFYAVLYSSWNRDAIGYITYFSPDGMQWTIPENCFNKLKTGIYASYSRSLFNRWNINVGGEVFYSETDSDNPYYKDDKESGWSGKLELNTSLMLTRKKNLIFNLRCTHYFPYQDGMIKYENRTFLNCELRYMLLDNRLTMTAAVTDPFGWSSTNSTATFNDYTLNSKNNVHQHAVALRISYSFGGKKVNNVYRDSKERESQRAN